MRIWTSNPSLPYEVILKVYKEIGSLTLNYILKTILNLFILLDHLTLLMPSWCAAIIYSTDVSTSCYNNLSNFNRFSTLTLKWLGSRLIEKKDCAGACRYNKCNRRFLLEWDFCQFSITFAQKPTKARNLLNCICMCKFCKPAHVFTRMYEVIIYFLSPT